METRLKKINESLTRTLIKNEEIRIDLKEIKKMIKELNASCDKIIKIKIYNNNIQWKQKQSRKRKRN